MVTDSFVKIRVLAYSKIILLTDTAVLVCCTNVSQACTDLPLGLFFQYSAHLKYPIKLNLPHISAIREGLSQAASYPHSQKYMHNTPQVFITFQN